MIAFLLAWQLIGGVIQGECGALGPQCDVLVASTMATRLEAGEYGDALLDVARDGYRGNAPATDDSLAAAWALVTGRIPAAGFAFAYSAEDAARMGWRTGDVVISGHGLTLHLAREAPWGSE